MQLGGSGKADFGRTRRRANTRHKQGFRRVNITDSDNQFAPQKHLFDRSLAFFKPQMEGFDIKCLGQRLNAQLAKQFLRGG